MVLYRVRFGGYLCKQDNISSSIYLKFKSVPKKLFFIECYSKSQKIIRPTIN